MSVDAFSLILHIDIFLIALATVFALSTIPRALARFSSAGEWEHGHLLRSIHPWAIRSRNKALILNDSRETLTEKIPPHVARFPFPLDHGCARDDALSDESHTYVPSLHLVRSISGNTLCSNSKPPAHSSAWSAVLPPMGRFLRHRLNPGFSVAQALVLGVYATVLLYASFLQSNPFEDPLRMGLVALSQIPVIFALGTKNNIIGMCIGIGYEKVLTYLFADFGQLNYIHRFAGLMMILLANFHAIGYIYTWTLNGEFATKMESSPNQMAFVALVSLDVLFFFSTPFWRRRAYNIFFASHIICFIIFVPTVYAHEVTTLRYLIVAITIYGLDHIVRLLKTRICKARIRPIPDLSVTRIEIPTLNAGWRAGQHVRIRVLSSGMGLIGWAEVHPFTIASIAKTPEGLVLLCKNAGGWTRRLHELAKVARYGREDGDISRMVNVMVDGPYGGPGHAVFASFSATMFVVGGSGVTFALSAIQDLIQREHECSSNVKVIELVWSIQDPSALNPLLPLFGSLMQQSTTPFRISVHYTRAADVPPEKNHLPPGLTLTAGRPRLAKVLDSVIARAVSYDPSVKSYTEATGVVVGVCGPVGLGDEVSQIVSAVEPGRRWMVGGIEIHEETFGW